MSHDNQPYGYNEPFDGTSTRRRFLLIGGTVVAGLSFSGLTSLAQAVPGKKPSDDASDLPLTKRNEGDGLLDDGLRPQIRTLFEDACQWVMMLDLGSGVCKIPNRKEECPFTWVNGNFARVLICGHQILDRPSYLAEALRWLDFLASHQQRTVASNGLEAGYWGDRTGPGNLYLADTGTALTALAMGCKLAGHERQEHYLAAMERFARFLEYGSREDPQGKGRGATSSWIIKEGKDKGALGCGYYLGHLSTAAYIISTAVTEIEFLCLLQSLNHDPKLTPVIEGGVRWLLAQQLPTGEFPYIIEGTVPKHEHWPLDTMTYVSEGLIAAYLYQDNPELRRDIAKTLKVSVDWLLRTQNKNGCWGEMKSADQERSPGCVTLLVWYYRTIEADPRIAAAVRNYCRFLLEPANREIYGYKHLVRTTGFIGLVLANLLKPDVTFQ